MKRQQANPYGIVSATLLAFAGTTGAILFPGRLDSIWLSLFAGSFIALYFSANVQEARPDENS
jgi:hypothetical protein